MSTRVAVLETTDNGYKNIIRQVLPNSHWNGYQYGDEIIEIYQAVFTNGEREHHLTAHNNVATCTPEDAAYRELPNWLVLAGT